MPSSSRSPNRPCRVGQPDRTRAGDERRIHRGPRPRPASPHPAGGPQFALSLIFGEFADAELTSSMRVIPAVLEQHGFEFEHHTIGEALAYANNSRPMK